jgi:hypothetical protein
MEWYYKHHKYAHLLPTYSEGNHRYAMYDVNEEDKQPNGHKNTMAWTLWNSYLSHHCSQPIHTNMTHREHKSTTPTSTAVTSSCERSPSNMISQLIYHCKEIIIIC